MMLVIVFVSQWVVISIMSIFILVHHNVTIIIDNISITIKSTINNFNVYNIWHAIKQ